MISLHFKEIIVQIIEPGFQILTPEIVFKGMLERLEAAGRTCYLSERRENDTAADFIKRIINRGHLTVIEHEIISVRIICDRGVSHELVRHRIASFSQESTRYCDYGGMGIKFIHPNGLNPAQIARREKHYYIIQKLYDAERMEGLSPQIARGVLPNSLKTELVMTCNLREWLAVVFKLRAAAKAHPQMQDLMYPMLYEFAHLLPAIFDKPCKELINEPS
jgi:thymidylate synthase (FAD)